MIVINCIYCAKIKIGVFQLLRDRTVDIFKMYNDQNQNAQGLANVAENESIRNMAMKCALIAAILGVDTSIYRSIIDLF